MQYFDPDRSKHLKTAFEEIVLPWPAVTGKTMFGCPSYQADGTLFAVLVTDGVALTRLPDEKRDELAQSFDTGPFRAGDRTVTKWVQITVDDPATLDTLRPFVEASYEHALGENG